MSEERIWVIASSWQEVRRPFAYSWFCPRCRGRNRGLYDQYREEINTLACECEHCQLPVTIELK